MIQKSDKAAKLAESYRPINLLPIISRNNFDFYFQGSPQ